MPRRRNVDIVGGEFTGRTGSIQRMDERYYLVVVDGGKGKPRSDGSVGPGDQLEVWIAKQDCRRTGDESRKVAPRAKRNPRYNFTVQRVQGREVVDIPQTRGSWAVYEFMDKFDVVYMNVQVSDDSEAFYHKRPLIHD